MVTFDSIIKTCLLNSLAYFDSRWPSVVSGDVSDL